MNNNNKLPYYLPHGVKISYYDAERERDCICDISRWNIDELEIIDSDNEYIIASKDATLFLYPLSCLTEPIVHNGVEEIPLVELAKIEGFKGDSYKINDKGYFCEYNYEFTYKDGSFEIWDTDAKEYTITENQLLLFDYLYSRRINIWGIDAIDPRTLEVNPYLITNKK